MKTRYNGYYYVSTYFYRMSVKQPVRDHVMVLRIGRLNIGNTADIHQGEALT